MLYTSPKQMRFHVWRKLPYSRSKGYTCGKPPASNRGIKYITAIKKDDRPGRLNHLIELTENVRRCTERQCLYHYAFQQGMKETDDPGQ